MSQRPEGTDVSPPELPLSIRSETGRLAACITVAPGNEFEHLLPRHLESALRGPDGVLTANPDYLLFDDLVQLRQLQGEHRTLVDVLTAVTGPRRQYDLRSMLRAVLADDGARAEILAEVLAEETALFGAAITPSVSARLYELLPDQLTEALIAGADPESGDTLLRWPMPNWLFARDCFAVVGDAIVLSRPRHRARRRDGLLARAICRHHPRLREMDRIDIAEGGEGEKRYLEGGDVLVVDGRLALIGVGIRTTEAAARALAAALRGRGVERVLGIFLPRRRAAMHLDTLFTLIDDGTCLWYQGAFADAGSGDQVEVVDLLDRRRRWGADLLGALADHGHRLQPIACGDGDPRAAEREQWTDGANAFALGPGRILLYGRNERTLQALNRAGFEVLTPAELIRNATLLMTGARRFVVALTGSELSRGRGGPRCLTLPLARG